ncbi:MAG: hypothetical protein MJD61_17275 [Proteobacteria bacterium]|nr:hypothetical protein [Pseudomonadota bacterium]
MRRLEAAAFVLLGALLFLYRIPYGFETGDQNTYLPLPYRSIYPGFVPGDWFTWETSHYHVTFSWVIRALHALAGEDRFAWAVLFMHAAVLVGLCAAIAALARACGWGYPASIACLLLTAIIRSRGLNGALLNHGWLVPADMALPAFLLACAAWIRGRSTAAGVWLGVAGLLHANYALAGALALGGLQGAQALARGSPRDLLKLALPFGVIAAPTLFVVLQTVTRDAAPEATPIYFVRSAHHYELVPVWNPDNWWPVALLVPGLGLWRSLGRDLVAGRGPWDTTGSRVLVLLLCLGVLQAAAALGTLAGFGAVQRLFLWRLSLPLVVLLALAVGEALRRVLVRRDVPTLVWTLAGLLLLLPFGALPAHFRSAKAIAVGLALVLAGAAVAGWAGRRRVQAEPAAASGHWRTPAGRALLASVLAAAVWLAAVSFPDRGMAGMTLPWRAAFKQMWTTYPLRLRERVHGWRGRLYAWIRTESPPDARFLVPPGMGDFRLQARRASFVDWKNCPIRGEELLEWRRRMFLVMGLDHFPARGYELREAARHRYFRLPASRLAHIARSEGLTHVVTWGARDHARAGLERVARFGSWQVYELR